MHLADGVLKPAGNATEPLAATGTDGQRSHQAVSERSGSTSENACLTEPESQRLSKVFSHYFPTGGAGIAQKLAETGEMKVSSLQSLMGRNALENKGVEASSRVLAGTVENTGEATRTPDLRIMRPPLYPAELSSRPIWRSERPPNSSVRPFPPTSSG